MVDDDRSFDEIMRMQGVTPLHNKPGPKQTQSPPHPSKVPIPPKPTVVPTGPSPQELEGQNAELEAKNSELVARGAALLSESTKTSEEIADLGRRLALAETRAEAAESALAEEQKAGLARSRELEKKKREAEANLSSANEELARLARRLGDSGAIREILEARGLRGESEFAIALGGLLLGRTGDLLDAIVLTEPQQLAQLLDQRIALAHESIAADLDPDTVVVQVPTDRCEIAGGSDIRATFHRLTQLCTEKKFTTITIVGGSHAYRKQLESLTQATDGDLKLNLVSGTQQRAARRVEADLRGSDLVVIWGSTRLDHSVSERYMRGQKKPLVIQHRGISGMLERLLATIDKMKT